jgi:hypothetical protein
MSTDGFLSRTWRWFRDTAEHIENLSAPFPKFVVLFLALLGIRLCLEFFSSHRLYTLDDIVHIGLWFTFVVLAFMCLLQAATGEAMIRTARLAIVCYVFSWSAPIIDLIVHRGVPARMNYIAINSWADFWQAYLTFGGPSTMRGATIGIRIEIACLVLACFLYVLGRRQSVVRALVSAVAIYSMLFATGAIPWLLGLLIGALGLQYATGDQSTVLLLFCLNAALLAYAGARHAPGMSRNAFSAVSKAGLVVALAAFAIGGALARQAYPENVALNPTTLFWPPMMFAMMFAFLLWFGLMRLNDDQSQSIRVALWVFVTLGASLIGERVAFAVQLVFASCWLWQDWLREWSTRRYVAAPAFALFCVATSLLGFQWLGGPMIGFPAHWLLAIALFAGAGAWLRPGVTPAREQTSLG